MVSLVYIEEYEQLWPLREFHFPTGILQLLQELLQFVVDVFPAILSSTTPLWINGPPMATILLLPSYFPWLSSFFVQMVPIDDTKCFRHNFAWSFPQIRFLIYSFVNWTHRSPWKVCLNNRKRFSFMLIQCSNSRFLLEMVVWVLKETGQFWSSRFGW